MNQNISPKNLPLRNYKRRHGRYLRDSAHKLDKFKLNVHILTEQTLGWFRQRHKRYSVHQLAGFILKVQIFVGQTLDWFEQGLKRQMEISVTGSKFQISAKKIKPSLLSISYWKALVNSTMVTSF